ncbi:MAG: HflC protein [Chloroflexi bacterium]|nr:HflC protein [Chloroflexota bacterium]
MRKTLIPLVVVLIFLFIGLPQVFFVVDETELAIVTRFGAFQRDHQSPGLKIKTPIVDNVTKFDKRLLRIDAPPTSLLTKDKKNLVIDAYARYKIVNPLLFFQSIGNELQAESKIGDIVNSRLRDEVAKDDQEEIISEVREEIMGKVTKASNLVDISRQEAINLPNGLNDISVTIELVSKTDISESRPASSQEIQELTSNPSPLSIEGFEVRYKLPLQDVFGAQIIDVRIKRADFPDAIQSSVFARMQAERERIAAGLRAEGAQRDAEIRANVDRQVTVLIETAQGTSARLRGEAESEAIAVLAESLNKDPELYAFKRYLETYAKSLNEGDTIVLSSDSPLFKYLKDQSVIEDLD